jgi:hypothetical protein
MARIGEPGWELGVAPRGPPWRPPAGAARPLVRATFEIYERGLEKRSLATIGALVKRARRLELARAQTCIRRNTLL